MDDIVTELAALRKRIATEYRDEDAVITLNRTVATITALRAALAECAEGMELVSDRLVHVYGESPNVDFVLTLRRRAGSARALLEPATERETTS